MLDSIYMQVLDMSKTASIVILVVILARLLLKKAPKVLSYALWAIVLFRLLCPVTFDAPMSIVPEMTSVSQGYTLSEEPISVLGASEAAYQAVGDALNGGLGVQHVPTTEKDETGMTRYVTTDWWSVWILFGQYVWVVGLAAMLVYSAVSYWKIRKKLAVVIPLRNNIFIADDIKSPFVVGLFRPKIFLPCNLGEKEQEYIILHEQHHIKRFDHIVKALAFLTLAIHWFNPLAWVAFVLASKDMEMSCDEAVIRKVGSDVRADYSASLLTLATGRRIIAGTPLAFGEGDTMGRIKNLSKWKKPAFWVVLMAVIVCIVLAVCLLTNPETKQDLSFLNYENLVSVAAQSDAHPASKSDDQSKYIIDGPQLAKFLDTANWTAQTGITRSVQRDTDQNSKSSIQISLNGTYLKVFDTDTANIYIPTTGKDRYYRMATGDYEKLLAMLTLDNERATNVIKWFDYLVVPDEMKWDGGLEINLPEFPDVTFRWSYGEMVAVKGNEITSLYTGMPIWNAYFCDLTGDDLPELCSTISWGSGMIDNRVIIYDYANGVSYSLEDRGVSDYSLRQSEIDGQLYVDKSSCFGRGVIASGRLVFQDNCLQILGQIMPNDAILEIIDPTDDPNFAYDAAVEKIFEDERNEYFISGLYSQHIIVQYTDGTQEDIVTALNAGRATFADLDKFGIRYWAEPKSTSFDIAENTVAEIGRGTLKSAVELSDEDATGLLSLIESGYWVEALDTSDCKNDCAVNLGGRLIYYCSECGTFTEYRLSEMSTTSHQSFAEARFWTMPLADQLFVNNILCKYIDLMYGITDVAAP